MIDPALLARLARLAAIDLSPEELAALSADLDGLLADFARLRDADGDADGLEPLTHVLEAADTSRADDVVPYATSEVLRDATGHVRDGFYSVSPWRPDAPLAPPADAEP